MADFPALPLFTDAFLADTTHLSAEETGAYVMLLMCAWRSPSCSLPNDDKKLARMARVSPARWGKIRDEVMAFWTLDEQGTWSQKRLQKERLYVEKSRAIKRDNGSKGGRPKPLKNNEVEEAVGSPPVKQNETYEKAPTPTPISKSSDTSVSGEISPRDPAEVIFRDGLALITRSGVPPPQARSFLGKMRKQHGDPALIAALGACQRTGAIDPIQFVAKTLSNHGGRNGQRDPRTDAAEQRSHDAASDYARLAADATRRGVG
ncbi:MAG: DUF1376 domain-containing protein [Pseudomonadota bacterium]